jgi:hypothetical protein
MALRLARKKRTRRKCRNAAHRFLGALFLAANFAASALAQSVSQPSLPGGLAQAVNALPDAPSEAMQTNLYSADPDASPSSRSSVLVSAPILKVSSLPEASPTQRYPKPGQPAPVLSARDKVRMALLGSVSPGAMAGWIFAAGYEQITNTGPNWGRDSGAFGRRLADAPIRDTSEDLLGNAVLAPLLHEDPRYYRLGHGHNPIARVLYAATRPLITRADDGRIVPNFALMSGDLAASALTNLYYPQQNRGVAPTFTTFRNGLVGTAIGNGIAEFFGGMLYDHNFRPTR